MRNGNCLPVGIVPIHVRRTHRLPAHASRIALHEAPARIQQCAFAGKTTNGKNERADEKQKVAHEFYAVAAWVLRQAGNVTRFPALPVPARSISPRRWRAVPARFSVCAGLFWSCWRRNQSHYRLLGFSSAPFRWPRQIFRFVFTAPSSVQTSPGTFLDGQRAETHLQTIEICPQCAWTGNDDAKFTL